MVDLNMVPLNDKSRTLSECETLNNANKINRNLDVKDCNGVLVELNYGLMGRFAGMT